MEKEERFGLYCELINCKYPFVYWKYDRNLVLQGTNSTDVHLWQRVFEGSGTLEELRMYCSQSSRPLMLDTALGVLWGAVSTESEIYVIGPVMGLEGNLHDMEESIRVMIDAGSNVKGENPSLSFRYRLTDALKQLPVVSTMDFSNDIAMLHCCLTGEKVKRSDIELLRRADATSKMPKKLRARKKDRHQTWMAEQALLRMVREGDLNYKAVFEHAGSVSTGVPVEGKDPLQKARFSCVTFTALCTRAAIEGGLTPEQAYTVGDSYLQQIEDGQTITDILAINHTMYEDFITRVHKCRTNPKISPQLQSCCDYIEMHIEEPIELEALAQRTGYTEYYLSRCFKREIGVSINNYIKGARIERAKMLLTSTDEPIRNIAERLQFCSSGYFAEVFQQVAGVKPQEWRKQTQK